jgi:hypothetical protein
MRSRLALAVLVLVAATGCATPGTDAPAAATASPVEPAGDIAALESAFWYCDWVATTEGVLATPMAACQFATSELKARKFGGSSRALAAWWRENKAAEHGRLGRAASRNGD